MQIYHVSMNIASIIKEIGRGTKGARSLGQDQATDLFGAMLDGTLPPLELGAILMALRIKGESLAELQGFQVAMDQRCRHIIPPSGQRCIIFPSYNGARRHPNLMPLVALLLARQGIPVLIQGRHDFENRINPFNLLAALGIPLNSALDETNTQLQRHSIAALAVEVLLPGLAQLLALRIRMGVRSSAHSLAKVLNPCPGKSIRVVPITHPAYQDSMTQFLITETDPAILMRGTEGEAYANPLRIPELTVFHHHTTQHPLFSASCLLESSPGLPAGPDIADNVTYIENVLLGKLPVPPPVQAQVDILAELAQSSPIKV